MAGEAVVLWSVLSQLQERARRLEQEMGHCGAIWTKWPMLVQVCGGGKMVTIPIKVSEELAERLAPVQEHLDQIIELGLQHWQGLPEASPMNPIEIETTEALQELVKYIKKGECILFLGAGVHAPPPEGSRYTYPAEERPPLGRDLAAILAKECNFMEKLRFKELPYDLQRVSLCFETTHSLGRKRLVDSLNRHLRVGKKPSPALKMLAGLPFKIIVTTNYDQLLETALRESGKDPVIFVYNPESDRPTPDMTEDPTEEQPLVFKMHGDLNHRDSIVITDEDYITFVQRMSDNKDALHPVPQTVRYRMLKWPTLFVGYSLRDYNLRLLFRILRWRVDTANFPPSFSVDKNPDPLILRVWQEERRFVTFVAKNLWEFVPCLCKQIP